MYPPSYQSAHYSSPDHHQHQQPYFANQAAARQSYSPELAVPSHHHQASSSSLHTYPSRLPSPPRHSCDSSLAHALDDASYSSSTAVASQHHQQQSFSASYRPKFPLDVFRYPSPAASSSLSPASPPTSFYDYPIANSPQYHVEQDQQIRDQEMLPIPEYASLSITTPSLPTPDTDEDEGMCMDEALMSCAEYEGSQFDAVVSDGGGGGPSGRTSGTIPDVNSGIVSGNMCEHAEDALNAARDPSFTSIYSPASSYDFEYDYDLPSYNVGDMVDSPVDGDFRFWGDGAVALEYPDVAPRHFHMEVPTRSYTLEAAITPPPEVPVPSAPCPKEDKKSEPQPQPTSTQTRTQPSPRAPRGRPRKNASRHSESLSIPKYRTDTSTSPPHTLHSQTLPSLPVSACSSMPHPAPTLSMDEIPVPDAESKPGQAVFKLTPSSIPGVTSGLSGAGAAAGKEGKKKPIMACLFCRERKIACGPPAPGSPNPRCNQCVRRGLECEYPKESRRGQHKRGPRAVRVQALTEEREQNASCSAPSSSASPAGHGSATSKSSQSGDSPSSNSVSSSSGASIKAGIKRKEKLVVNGKSSSKAKGKSPVKKEEGEMEASIRRA